MKQLVLYEGGSSRRRVESQGYEWEVRTRFDKDCLELADRHYSRQKVGSSQFVPPGSCLVLYRPGVVWVSLHQKYIMHEFKDTWSCPIFRNESCDLSSDLIRSALEITKAEWNEKDQPIGGFITFVDASKVSSSNPGYCFKRAGFKKIGETKSGKQCLHIPLI